MKKKTGYREKTQGLHLDLGQLGWCVCSGRPLLNRDFQVKTCWLGRARHVGKEEGDYECCGIPGRQTSVSGGQAAGRVGTEAAEGLDYVGLCKDHDDGQPSKDRAPGTAVSGFWQLKR